MKTNIWSKLYLLFVIYGAKYGLMLLSAEIWSDLLCSKVLMVLREFDLEIGMRCDAMWCVLVSFGWFRCVCSALTLQIFSTFCLHQIEKFRIKFLWYKTKANAKLAILAKRSNVLATWAAQGTLTQLFSQMCKYVKDTLKPQFVYPCMVSHAGRIL